MFMIWQKKLIIKRKAEYIKACEELEKILINLPIQELHSKEELMNWLSDEK